MKSIYRFTEEDVENVLDDLELCLNTGELEEACELVKIAFEEREHEVAEDALATFQETLRHRWEWEHRRVS